MQGVALCQSAALSFCRPTQDDSTRERLYAGDVEDAQRPRDDEQQALHRRSSTQPDICALKRLLTADLADAAAAAASNASGS